MIKTWWTLYALATVLVLAAIAGPGFSASTIQGYVLDPNWYAPHPRAAGVMGTGQYEYGISGNPIGNTGLGFFANTETNADNFYWGIYGFFRKPNQTDGVYTLATWDNWWRSEFRFGVQAIATTTPPIFMRLHANMWSYAPTWTTGYNEFGQTFVASGSSVVLLVMRNAASSVSNVELTFHEGGPGGQQVGIKRVITLNGGLGDTRVHYNGGDIPTVPGNTYYLKIKSPTGQFPVLCNNEPIPDFSDAMPGGAAYHEGQLWDAGRDLGITICSDDDGIVTNAYVRPGGTNLLSATSVGQTFMARGTALISFTAWIPDGNNSYVATLYDAVNGNVIGTPKKNRLMRWGDPEIMWTWGVDECPLVPGGTYYIEVTREDGATMGPVYANQYAAYMPGEAYRNRVSQGPSVDLACTIMEEESNGSADMPRVEFTTEPAVAFADRGVNTLTVRWQTSAPTDSKVEYAAWNAPYTDVVSSPTPTTDHVVTLTGLEANTMYHLRVSGQANGYRPVVGRDFVTCTINGTKPNLLVNPGFEEGTGSVPRKPVIGWTYSGIDTGASDGGWFWGLPPYAGNWFMQCAINGGDVTGNVHQRVTGVTPGKQYNFTLAVTSWMRENNNWKYDVWQAEGRLDQIRIGIDPTGGTDPNASTVKWTPSMYSHLRYTVLGTKAVAQSSSMTVFMQMRGRGGEWHLYGFDDCRLSEVEAQDETAPTLPVVQDSGAYTLDKTKLTASWSSSDPETGIGEYQYSIGTSAGAEDVLNWTSAGQNTGATITGLSLNNGVTYYINVRARNGAGLWSAVGSSDGVAVPALATSIGQAKGLADGTAVQLAQKTVIGRANGSFWIQETDRSSGIRVMNATPLTVGNSITLAGVLGTVEGERRLSEITLLQAGAGIKAEPLRIGLKALGGTDLNQHTPGIAEASGLHNVGLLVMVYGKITAIGDGYFYLDDGSNLRDGTSTSGQPNVGVRIQGAPAEGVVGDFVEVVGISGTFDVGEGDIQRLLIPISGYTQ